QGTTDVYPSRPVRVVVGLAPGGGTDIQTRLIAQKLSENLGRSFVVENRTGAGGTVAYAFVAKSAPDGYTVLGVASGYSITPAVFHRLGYDPIRDFAPISLAIEAPILLLVHPALPAKNVKDLIALAKASPDALDFGSAGHGTSNHMAMELFKSMAGVKLVHVPYKGTGQALSDLVAGQIPVLFGNILSCLPYVKAGRLRALAVSSRTRSAALPQLPTIAESGVPGYVTTTWHGWLAPAGTPPAIVQRLSVAIAKVVKSPDVMEKMAGDGGEAVGSTPEQFAAHLITEIGRWRKVVAETGMRIE
ncbi:MAG: tripartite tricarboxylate transporter substrate binding protein, partial [Burkholderiales bacterium]